MIVGLAVIVGVALGLVLQPTVPVDLQPYLPIAVVAALDGKAPRAYVCAGRQCAPPVERPDDLALTLSTFAIGPA